MEKRALITGITGQDGSYLAELLVDKGYRVFGIVRRSSGDTIKHIEHLRLSGDISIIHGDVRDAEVVKKALAISEPDEIYNFASQSHVGISFDCPEETDAINYTFAKRLKEEALKLNKKVKIFQASSSEMFGDAPFLQDEKTPFHPLSPYAQSKVRAHEDYLQTRKNDNAFICSGILYNHESPRRSKNFVTRKITHSMAKIKLGLQDNLELGNLLSARDWGFAKDYVYAIWLIMQQSTPDDFIIASGKLHTVKDFINTTAEFLEMKLHWEGTGINEKAFDESGKPVVLINSRFFRPVDPNNLVGNITKAKNILHWQPKTNFPDLVKIMTEHDLKQIGKYE